MFKKVIMMCGILFVSTNLVAIEPVGAAADVGRVLASLGVGYLYYKNCKRGLNWKRLAGGLVLGSALSASGGKRVPSAIFDDYLQANSQVVAHFLGASYIVPAALACGIAGWRGYWDVMWERKDKTPDDGLPAMIRSSWLALMSTAIGAAVGFGSMVDLS